MALLYAVYDTPIDDITLISNSKRLIGLLFGAQDPIGMVNDENTVLYDGIVEINQFFFGQRKVFDLKLDPGGDGFRNVSDFDHKVYDFVLGIGFGQTFTYEEVACAIGEPDKVGEVKKCLENNPLPIFVPCHRVVESEEDLGVYCGGVELKRRILALEKAVLEKGR